MLIQIRWMCVEANKTSLNDLSTTHREQDENIFTPHSLRTAEDYNRYIWSKRQAVISEFFCPTITNVNRWSLLDAIRTSTGIGRLTFFWKPMTNVWKSMMEELVCCGPISCQRPWKACLQLLGPWSNFTQKSDGLCQKNSIWIITGCFSR